ncbi:helix-turn-helix domain-containing protein [Streptomyces sp. NPDC001922]|uniref:helix-turn-helix domain-containing protein n=1 Tax=Streptomyces sp. NPDC001922 TaxID=3364624 RepID=UPI0036D10A10
MAASSYPPSTVLGRQLGGELRTLREQKGFSTADVAAALECTKGKVSRIENGRVPLRNPDLVAMLRMYGADESTSERLGSLARTANRRRRTGWWNEYGTLLADTYRDFIAMEAEASLVRTFQSQTVPALLQTAEYAQALAVASRWWKHPEEIEQFVAVRIKRQLRLTSEEPLQVWAVIAEGALRQHVGGPHVMRAQLEHITHWAQQEHVTVQVVPFRTGAHASMGGPYVLLSFPDDGSLDVALLDNPSGSIWLEKAEDVAVYRTLWDDVRTSALSPADSVQLINSIKEHLQ